MKVINHTLVKSIFLLNLLLITSIADSQTFQKTESQIVDLDTVQVLYRTPEFNQLVTKITSAKNFKYRKTLRNSKSINKEYYLDNVKISEADLLKHFKKAARKSESVEGFVSYFEKMDMGFLKLLDPYDLQQLYNVIRKTTFNGFLDDWQRYY